ncbi:hypothetical protein [Falsibacillus pallidus]
MIRKKVDFFLMKKEMETELKRPLYAKEIDFLYWLASRMQKHTYDKA